MASRKAAAFAARIEGRAGGLIRAMFAPDRIETCTPALLQRTAALAACNEARTSGPACVVVLVIRPEGWEPGRPLQLSTDATAALRGDFRRLGRNRVMAISETTGQWGIGSDLTEALAAFGETDCRAVIDG